MITLTNVSKTYEKGIAALKDINIDIGQGEFVFIVGDSGSGKSTMIKLLLKEFPPTEGQIVVAGKDLSRIKHRDIPEYRRKVGCVFQDFRLLQDRNVYENVAFAMRVTGATKRDIKRRVPQMLSRVGLASKYRSLPSHLSGGEQQRVAIARALVNHPKILLADEPTGNLDGHNAWEIMKLLDEINKDGTTVLVVTHNMEIVRAMNKRVITIYRGTLMSDEEEAEP
ncbi:MAG: cell division ATP-binding protein FtsE [Lachnospiraceae bacterium]|nr:cell division ATP-binding protein FtsE [Lachnospiraceae bacterium]MDD7326590.1 cell division ATP-binding protein FtsE [Lachnospiraceae bacterium]MDY2758721.1 cell division ATP-binding protein FtsE [Lachnospiraceae bacterium]